MRSKSLLALGLFALGSGALFAQGTAAQGTKLEFEVASVRPAPPQTAQDRVNAGVHMDGLQVRINSLTLRDYVAMAYRVRIYQVSGPDWVGMDRFNISAKLPEGGKADQIPEMLQTLLADRFQLKIHRDKKELPVYALILGKTPLKLKEVPASPEDNGPAGVALAATGGADGVSVDMGHGSSYTFANNKFEGRKLSMEMLTRQLERYVDRPLLDMTNLKGNYDVTLPVTQEDYQIMLIRIGISAGVVLPPQVVQLAEGKTTPSLLDAVQEAGLKLDARKAPVELIVVDSALKTPTDN